MVAHRYGSRVLPSIVDAVGSTPLVRLGRTDARFGPEISIWAKLEWFNPGGSVKDRAARQMLLEALEDGRLKPGGTVIDSTSGNTGIAYAWLCAALGVRCCLVMPENVTHGRKAFTRTLGAEIVYSDPLEGSDGAIVKAQAMVDADPDRYFYPDQYSNPANPRSHELGTAEEIWAQTNGAVTHFVAGIGTTGTVMGTGRGLKAHSPAVQILAVEPDDSLHGLEGLKHIESSLRPAIWQPEGVVDEILPVGTEAGWDRSEALLVDEGLAVGHSGGAAVVGAIRVAERLQAAGEGGTIVTLFPDRADRYFEAGVWDPSQVW